MAEEQDATPKRRRRRVRFILTGENEADTHIKCSPDNIRGLSPAEGDLEKIPWSPRFPGFGCDLTIPFQDINKQFITFIQEKIEQGKENVRKYQEQLIRLQHWFDSKFESLYLAFRGLNEAENIIQKSEAGKPYQKYSALFLAYMYANAAYLLEEEQCSDDWESEEDAFLHMRERHLYLRLHNIMAEIAIVFLQAADRTKADENFAIKACIHQDRITDYTELLRTFCTLDNDVFTSMGNQNGGMVFEDLKQMTRKIDKLHLDVCNRDKSKTNKFKEENKQTEKLNGLHNPEFFALIDGASGNMTDFFESLSLDPNHSLIFEANGHNPPSRLIENLCSALYQIVLDKVGGEIFIANNNMKLLESFLTEKDTINPEEIGSVCRQYEHTETALKKVIWSCCETIDRKFQAITSKFNSSCYCGQLLHIYVSTDPENVDKKWLPDIEP